jgi:hypothetical protein
LKIETRNKKYRDDTIHIDKKKLETLLKATESDLLNSINLLNEKEKLVYDVQTQKFKGFSNEIQIFESIHNELNERSQKTEVILKEKKDKKKKDNFHLGLENADYESYLFELDKKEQEREDLMSRIGAIERTYPKEFEYLYQDLVLKKELMEVSNERKEIKRKLKYKEEKKEKLKISILNYEDKLEDKKKEIINLRFKIDETQNDSYYRTLETYLENHVSDIMKFDKAKLLIQSNFFNKFFYFFLNFFRLLSSKEL